MKQRRNKSYQEKSKKNDKIIRYSFLTRPVFENEISYDFIQNINKEVYNNYRICKYPF